ncbi:membrane-anchored junction protein isoform X3 [Acanthopagrus latus]|uniref:membrane-anchored junction protein isoform X3 n=1 Tax=Acanthopagrus latus TaxID=8177 RepID=UPI00187CA81A|nr:membrane-anchored junction protein isoform X3 [Acanthopagrus latus]
MPAIFCSHYGNLRSAMTVQIFIRAGGSVYQFRIRGGSSCSGEEAMGGNCFDQELEEIIRTVLGNLESLQPFSSAHFNVYPYKQQREGVSSVLCQHYERKLRVYPFILHVYLERNMRSGKRSAEQFSPQEEAAEQIPSASELQSKRRKRDSTLEDAVLKDLEAELEAEAKVSVRLHVDKKRRREEEVEDDPGHADENDKPQQKSGVSMTGSGAPDEVDEGEEEEDNAESAKPGVLTRLVSSVFPFSWFFRTPERRG